MAQREPTVSVPHVLLEYLRARIEPSWQVPAMFADEIGLLEKERQALAETQVDAVQIAIHNARMVGRREVVRLLEQLYEERRGQ